jgi:Ca2+-binding RTX toxin-like protein
MFRLFGAIRRWWDSTPRAQATTAATHVKPPVSAKPAARKPTVEPLEDRLAPSTAYLNNGVLAVYGTNNPELIRVTRQGAKVVVEGVGWAPAAQVRELQIFGYGGNDYVDIRTTSIHSHIDGGDGDDFIVGSLAKDVIHGGEGRDHLLGSRGNDILYGDGGNDVLLAGDGNDQMYGGAGSDFMDDGDRKRQEYYEGGADWDWNADVVGRGGATRDDVFQQGASTCVLMSVLSGLAGRGYNFRSHFRYGGFDIHANPFYIVQLWKGGKYRPVKVLFDGTISFHDPKPAAEGESWVILMQRAWIKFTGADGDGRASARTVYLGLTGRRPQLRQPIQVDDFRRIGVALARGRVITAATRADYVSDPMLVKNHSYTVIDTTILGGHKWVLLRNPWGADGPDTQTPQGADDGYIWVHWDQFRASMTSLSVFRM